MLNLVGNLAKAFRHLDWLDYDQAGRRSLRTRYKEKAVDCSGVYAGGKDPNEHLQMKLNKNATNK
ncbi:hypothetical protein [Parabacteroides bouchesdurhonensis]|uniref:hypothetical protein n=1 Tax=Parabacteroides bouchesdurhonensis TaxID=1936995 RepID=UPI00131D3E30